MAKISGVIQFSGKLGQVVGMKGRSGRNYLRQSADAIKNPRSTGQNIQRMILATVGQSIGYLKEICNNSVEGKANGNETLSYLRSQWMRMLRVSDINSSPYNYAKKGSGIFITNPYMLSKGTLFVPQYSCNGSAGTLVCSELNRDATKPSELFPSIAVGNQITIVSVGLDDRDMGQNDAYIPVIKYCRFAFKNDYAAPLVYGALNPDAIDLNKAEGDWQKLAFNDGESIDLTTFTDNLDIAACAIIVSNIADKKRSTSYLALANNILGLQWPAAEAYPTFGVASTPIDVPSEVYLDNSTTVITSAEISGVVSLQNAPISIPAHSSAGLNFANLPGQPTEVKLNVVFEGMNYVTSDLVSAQGDAVIAETQNASLTIDGDTGVFEYANNAATVTLIPVTDTDNSWTVTGGFMRIDGKIYTF